LGAVHLLAHQFLAFKINAAGARSDLVYSEPPSLELLERSSAALVLTEWKVAADAKVAQKRFTEARKQAELYRQGPLAAVELTSYRYAIVVTKKQVPIPHDELAFDVTYRHINIAIEPNTPSAAAKKKSSAIDAQVSGAVAAALRAVRTSGNDFIVNDSLWFTSNASFSKSAEGTSRPKVERNSA
jgi:hypothetical protein